MSTTLEIDIVGSTGTISEIQRQFDAIGVEGAKMYHHRGTGGEAAVAGVVASVLLPLLPKLLTSP